MHACARVQHNNTTPDDIGICEAYLAFMRADGDNGAYWKVLDSHGAPAPPPPPPPPASHTGGLRRSWRIPDCTSAASESR